MRSYIRFNSRQTLRENPVSLRDKGLSLALTSALTLSLGLSACKLTTPKTALSEGASRSVRSSSIWPGNTSPSGGGSINLNVNRGTSPLNLETGTALIYTWNSQGVTDLEWKTNQEEYKQSAPMQWTGIDHDERCAKSSDGSPIPSPWGIGVFHPMPSVEGQSIIPVSEARETRRNVNIQPTYSPTSGEAYIRLSFPCHAYKRHYVWIEGKNSAGQKVSSNRLEVAVGYNAERRSLFKLMADDMGLIRLSRGQTVESHKYTVNQDKPDSCARLSRDEDRLRMLQSYTSPIRFEALGISLQRGGSCRVPEGANICACIGQTRMAPPRLVAQDVSGFAGLQLTFLDSDSNERYALWSDPDGDPSQLFFHSSVNESFYWQSMQVQAPSQPGYYVVRVTAEGRRPGNWEGNNTPEVSEDFVDLIFLVE